MKLAMYVELSNLRAQLLDKMVELVKKDFNKIGSQANVDADGIAKILAAKIDADNALEKVQEQILEISHRMMDDPLEADPNPVDGLIKETGNQDRLITQPNTRKFDPKNYLSVKRRKRIPIYASRRIEGKPCEQNPDKNRAEVVHFLVKTVEVEEDRCVRPAYITETMKNRIDGDFERNFRWDEDAARWVRRESTFDPKFRHITSAHSRVVGKRPQEYEFIQHGLREPVDNRTFYGRVPGMKSIRTTETVTGRLDRETNTVEWDRKVEYRLHISDGRIIDIYDDRQLRECRDVLGDMIVKVS
jgi:hypothetical protein